MTTINAVLATKGRQIHAVEPSATVFEALKKMEELDVGSLAVMRGSQLVGIMSERDYARKVILQGRSSLDTPVQDIMISDVVCAAPEHTVEQGMALMTAHAVRHLPIVVDNEVVGIVSIGDLVKSIIQDREFIIDQLEHYIHG